MFEVYMLKTNKEGLLRCVSCFEKGEGAGGDEGSVIALVLSLTSYSYSFIFSCTLLV